MLKKRIVIATTALSLSLLLNAGISQATPLSWAPAPNVLEKLAQWWDLLPGTHPAARPARHKGTQTKNGCGIDPNGGPLCGG
ncbi:MAG TPA: hypothetical protein VGH73_01860 [Thermoanaerobaculia bacterium]|jgi:hypothetical protein